MRNPKVVYKDKFGSNLSLVIRYPRSGDAKTMCDYINKLSKEKTYITYQGEKITLKEEEEYLKSQLEKIKKHKSVQFLVFVDNKLSGISSIDLGKRVERHVGVLGISLAKQFRGRGLGKLLTKLVLSEAKENLPELKIVTLEVMDVNPVAIKLYKSFGFKEYGKLPKGNYYKNDYVNVDLMYKEI